MDTQPAIRGSIHGLYEEKIQDACMSDTAKGPHTVKEKELPLYNSQIINNYLEYLHIFYPDIDTDVILDHADMKSYQLEDGGHWFSQRQISRFQSCLFEMTNNPELPREVGRFVALSKTQRPLQKVTLGFVTPAAAYRWLEKMYPLMSRASVLKVQSLNSNTVEVTNILKPGVKETPGQCQNRIGTYEAISMVFSKKVTNR